VKEAFIEVDPSVDRKVKDPPEQLVGFAPGHERLRVPGGEETFEMIKG
jgi:hypothetical protein